MAWDLGMSLCSVGVNDQDDSGGLVQNRADIMHRPQRSFKKSSLIKYERSSIPEHAAGARCVASLRHLQFDGGVQ